MKKKISIINLFLASGIFLMVSCAGTDRISDTRVSRGKFQLRAYREEVLPNGLRIFWIKEKSLPRIGFELLVQSGSAVDRPGFEGTAQLAAALLDQGTKFNSAPVLAEKFAQIGSDFEASASHDYTLVSASGLSASSDTLLKLFSEVILSPSFSKTEFDRVRDEHRVAIERAQDSPQGYADELLQKDVFGRHPYGVPTIGTKESLKNLSRLDIQKYYDSYYRPANSSLAVVGSFDNELETLIRKEFSSWVGEKPLPNNWPKVSFASGLKKIYSKKELAQTQIRMGMTSLRRDHPDYLALRLGTLVIGGAFASRLNQRIRDDLGLTYSINASIEAMEDQGSFEVATFTRNEKTAEVIIETNKVLDEAVKMGITEKELEAAKNLMIGQFPAAVETPDRLAVNLMVLRRYGIADTYLSKFVDNIQALSLPQVNGAIRRHIKPNQLNTIIFADQKQILEQVQKLGQWEVSEVPKN